MDVVMQSGSERVRVAILRENVVTVGEREIVIEAVERRPGGIDGRIAGQHRSVEIARSGDRVFAWSEGRSWSAKICVPPIDDASVGSSQSGSVLAPMPGVVVSVHVEAQEPVQMGCPLITIESMKMQIVLTAERDGIVETIEVGQGVSFAKGALLVSLAPMECIA